MTASTNSQNTLTNSCVKSDMQACFTYTAFGVGHQLTGPQVRISLIGFAHCCCRHSFETYVARVCRADTSIRGALGDMPCCAALMLCHIVQDRRCSIACQTTERVQERQGELQQNVHSMLKSSTKLTLTLSALLCMQVRFLMYIDLLIIMT